MSQEKDTFSNPEFSKENLREIADKQAEHIRDDHERSVEKTPERNQESARSEALEQARSAEKERSTQEKASSPVERRLDVPSKKAKLDNFNREMSPVRAQMSPVSRAFSKTIHNPVVEKTSEVIGSTVARPNAILSGAVFAFIATLGVYLVAKYFGYPLSGFETIGSFVLGWIIGIIYDYARLLIVGRS